MKYLSLALMFLVVAPLQANDVEFFEKRVRPILVEHCFSCHANGKDKGGFTLDSRAALLKGGESGPAIVPGEPAKSRLIEAVRYADDLKMPPKGKLSAEAIADLETWVKAGAVWPGNATTTVKVEAFNLPERAKHWSFQPMRNIEPPMASDPAWNRTIIDRFIHAKLSANGLKPAPPAEKITLLRRVTFDLIGLPPTIEEIDAFVADTSPTAFERVVERLLASPHYGERWGRHWLDLVRYAETQGHEFDFDISEAWRYRDYVVRAFNADLPYDRFLTEHVAGDLVSPPRRTATGLNESIVGTGFWFLGEAKHSPVDVRQDQADRTDNQIDVFSKTFLGVTVACARCHDHKFDPIPTKDYYALYGYLTSSRFEKAILDAPEARATALAAVANAKSTADSQVIPVVADRMLHELTDANWLTLLRKSKGDLADVIGQAFAKKSNAVQTRRDAEAKRAARLRESRSLFGNWLVSGDGFTPRATTVPSVIAGTDPSRPIVHVDPPGVMISTGRGIGALRTPNFVLDGEAVAFRVRGQGAKVNLILDGFQLIMNPIYGSLTASVKDEAGFRWHVIPVSMWKGHSAYLEFLDPEDGTLAVEDVRLLRTAGPIPEAPNRLLTDLLANSDADSFAERLQTVLREILTQWKSGTLTDPDRIAVLNMLLAVPEFSKLAVPMPNAWAEVKKAEKAVPPVTRAMALIDGNGENEHVFIRGNPKALGAEVPRRFLEVLGGATMPTPTHGSGRLELARRMTEPTNPLTARVMVNRIWKHHFGVGLVPTPDDFGKLGTAPTHPELLDSLAIEFIASGWSVKQMHRRILNTATYRMASGVNDPRDPTNKLLHHFPIRRLEAEAIRDAMLSISGRLNPTVGGPSVAPHVTAFMEGRGKPGSGPVDGNGRRSIYLGVRRNFLNPMFLAFDYPTPFTTIGQRGTSNVPAQALTMLNNPLVSTLATTWAKRELAVERTPDERLKRMYRQAFGRSPTPAESKELLAFVDGQLAEYGSGSTERAWADVAHVLWNVKEFIFVP